MSAQRCARAASASHSSASCAAAPPSPCRARKRALALPIAAVLLLGAAAGEPQTAPPPRIREAGRILYCSDLTTPPLGFLGESGEPQGSDVDLGNALASQLGVRAQWKNIPFKGIVAALLAGECDAVISQLFVKPERREVLDFVPYMNSSQSLLVRSGGPRAPHGLADLSGLRVAVQTGTTIAAALEAQNRAFADGGGEPMRIAVFPRDTDALQQLAIGQADVYGTTLETAAHYMAQAPGRFELAGPPFDQVLTGIGVRKGERELASALEAALAALRADGRYRAIFARWKLEADLLP